MSGFLGAARIDRFGNLNTTVIGPYERPHTRLPGAGGAPEIVAHAKQTFVMLKATPRSFVPALDFCTSAGFLDGQGARARTAGRGRGPSTVICDFGMLTPDPHSDELTLTALFADVARNRFAPRLLAARWAGHLDTIAVPSAHELDATLRPSTPAPVRTPNWCGCHTDLRQIFAIQS